jgi:hypothetical protein
MSMQSYATAPGRNTATSSGPPKKGLIEKQMMEHKLQSPPKKAPKKVKK